MLPQFLIFCAVMLFLLYGTKHLAKANPSNIKKLARESGGWVAMAGAGWLALTGRMELAIAVGGFGLYLMGFLQNHKWAGLFQNMGIGPKKTLKSSTLIAFELDHVNGTMSGKVLGGRFFGQSLADLTQQQCVVLLADCLREDPEGARLLEAYLDRRFAGWRQASDGYSGAGRGGGNVARQPAAMAEDEAYKVLGLAQGASREDISAAHRALMKKLHPDHGGTSSLAARVNEAREVLMRRFA